jgi:Holliday junction DNA helicase RuvB
VFGVDELGLDKVDRAVLTRSASSSVVARSGSAPWPSAVGEQPETVEDMYEPFLIQQGLLMRTPRGTGGATAVLRQRWHRGWRVSQQQNPSGVAGT